MTCQDRSLALHMTFKPRPEFWGFVSNSEITAYPTPMLVFDGTWVRNSELGKWPASRIWVGIGRVDAFGGTERNPIISH